MSSMRARRRSSRPQRKWVLSRRSRPRSGGESAQRFERARKIARPVNNSYNSDLRKFDAKDHDIAADWYRPDVGSEFRAGPRAFGKLAEHVDPPDDHLSKSLRSSHRRERYGGRCVEGPAKRPDGREYPPHQRRGAAITCSSWPRA